jgi:hypothetical protein
MSASTQEDVNTYVVGDRVKFNEKHHFLYGNKGKVTGVFGISVEIKMDDKLTIITSYKNLKKIKLVKKNENGSGNTKTNNGSSKNRTRSGRVSKSSGSKKGRTSK